MASPPEYGTIDSSPKASSVLYEPTVGYTALPVVSPVEVNGSGVNDPFSNR